MIAEIDITQITVSLFTLIGVLATSYFSFRSNRNSRQINDAVNNIQKTGGVRIYDLALKNAEGVDELLEWKRSFNNSPWSSGEGVQQWLKEHDMKLKALSCKTLKPSDKTTRVNSNPNPSHETDIQK